jgi:hypothetical protein
MKKSEPVAKRFSGDYWKGQLTSAEDRRKDFLKAAEESIKVYNAHKHLHLFNDVERRINVWWYIINTLLPAYYSSTPKAEVLLKKRSGGVLHEMSSVILERNLQYQMDCEFNFDQVGYNAALQFLLTGQAVLWARYRFESETEDAQVAYMLTPEGKFVDSENEEFEGDPETLVKGVGGIYTTSVEVEKKGDERAILEVVQYNDYLCSDARDESEVEWRARRAFLTRAQATELFGEDLSSELSYDSFPEAIKKNLARDRQKYEGKAELYEIWCEEAKKVFWVHKNGEKTIVQSGEPPIEFEKFYPCTVITQSCNPESVIPVSDYTHVKDQILEVERLTTRIHAMVQAIRANGAYDSTLGTLVDQLFSGDLKMYPFNNWPSYKSKGGLANSIEMLNIEPYVSALKILQESRQIALDQLYEILKVSDLLRGTSEQYKTATANRLENAWSSMGLIVRQNMFTKFISDGIANLGAIIISQFDEERIMNVGDADQLLMPLVPPQEPPPPAPPMDPNMPPEMQQMAPPPPPPIDPMQIVDSMKKQIMDLFRDEDQFNYRIQIASDSMVAIDYAQEQQEGQQLMATAGEFFNQMRSLVEQYPPLLDFSIQLFQNVIKRYKSGKELDGIFINALKQIQDISKAKEEAAKQPPPPDPVMQEMQARMQIAQMESQARIQATQMEMQDKHEKNMLAAQEQQLKLQRDQLDAQLSIQKQQFEEYIKQQELVIMQQEVQVKANSVQVDMLKVQAMAETETNKQAIAQETNRMSHLLDLQKLELENMRVRLAESEKLMEERRLASDSQLERVRLQMENINQTPKIMSMGSATGRKKSGKIITDDNGNPTAIEITEQPEVKIQRITLDEEGNPSGIEIG